MLKKLLAVLLIVMFGLTVSSCGKPEPETASKVHVYSEERLEIEDGLDQINKVVCGNDKIYIMGTRCNYDENGSLQKVSYPFYIMNLDGAVEKEFELDFTVSNFVLHISDVCVDSRGFISAVTQDYTSGSLTLYRFSPEGEKLGDVRLSGVFKDIASGNSMLRGFMPLDGNRYLIAAEQGAAIITADGETENIFRDSAPAEASYISGICRTADGRYFMVYTIMAWDEMATNWEQKSELIELDFGAGTLGERRSIAANGRFLDGTDQYDLLIVRESCIASYDLETGETEVILDWIKSGIDKESVPEETVNILPDGRIVCQNKAIRWNGRGGNMDYDDMYISLLTEIPPEEMPDRKLIKLFALRLDNDIRQQILKFNKNNLEYEIELTSFADYDNGLDRMNTAMLSGNVPDVLVLGKDDMGYDILADAYISKGLLANLYDFMDADPDFDRGDYLENYFKAYELDGKLYELAPTFYVYTLVAKTSRVGAESGWTMEEFGNVTENLSGEEILGKAASNKWVLNEFLYNCSDSYIDRGRGRCSFDSEEFISVLKFCGRFPDEVPEQGPDNYEIHGYLREDKQLLDIMFASTPNTVRILEKGDFGESVTFKGYPCSMGNGSCFFNFSGVKFSISSKSAVSEGAWKFVKLFLSDEYQDMYSEQQSGNVPIKLTSIEKKFENDQRPFEYIGGDGNIYYEEKNLYYSGTTKIDIGYPDEADAEKMMSFIKSVETVQRRDRYVSGIVQEEAGAYFSGQKSAEETAEIIQNRVQNYLDENR